METQILPNKSILIRIRLSMKWCNRFGINSIVSYRQSIAQTSLTSWNRYDRNCSPKVCHWSLEPKNQLFDDFCINWMNGLLYLWSNRESLLGRVDRMASKRRGRVVGRQQGVSRLFLLPKKFASNKLFKWFKNTNLLYKMWLQFDRSGLTSITEKTLQLCKLWKPQTRVYMTHFSHPSNSRAFGC